MALSAELRAFKEVPNDIRQWSRWIRETLTEAISGTIDTDLLVDDSITFAKTQNIATDKVLGRATAGSGDIEELTCTAAGRALLDDADAAAQLVTLGIASGSYTPTLSNVTNLAASTAYVCQYQHIGNIVHVSGKVDVDPTGAGACLLGVALPVASNFVLGYQCAGTACCPTIAGFSAAVTADTTLDRAQIEWIAVDATNQPLYFSFMYRVL